MRASSVIVILAWMCSTANAAEPAALDAAFAIVADAVHKQEIPGAVGLVAQRGRIIRQQAFGVADVEAKRPFTPDTLCWIASITKPITVAAAMKLVEDGRLSLDDRVEDFLPEFKKHTDAEGTHWPVTVRQLMSHTSGIIANPPSRPNFFFEAGWMAREIKEIPPLVAQMKLEFEPGSRVLYSNAAPYVLGRIVELKSGQPFGEFVTEKILRPAGMHDTFFAVPEDSVSRIATVYREARGERVAFCRYDSSWKVSMTMPDGGLFSTARDIQRFVQVFLDNDGRVLSSDSVRAMLTRQSQGWGLGWGLEQDGVFHHSGSSGTTAWADPKTGVVGVLFFQLQNQRKIDPLQAEFRKAVRKAFETQ
jgi:CubicO group peptidase (beta-lactamase class C family)